MLSSGDASKCGNGIGDGWGVVTAVVAVTNAAARAVADIAGGIVGCR